VGARTSPVPGGLIGWGRRAVVIAVLAAVLWPVVRGHDSFPLSTYPMYAQRRGDVVAIATAVGIDAEGRSRRLSLHTIADTDDPLIAESALQRAIASGSADATCREIAARAGEGTVAVELVEEWHDVAAQATGRDSLRDRTVHATCEVPA
jgi:hypothetical protein